MKDRDDRGEGTAGQIDECKNPQGAGAELSPSPGHTCRYLSPRLRPAELCYGDVCDGMEGEVMTRMDAEWAAEVRQHVRI